MTEFTESTMPERDKLTPTEQVRRLVERNRQYWTAFHQAADEEDGFLDGDRYENNEDYANRDKRLIQVHGNETDDTIRHMAAAWSQKPMNLQARPIDKMGDPASGEFMVGLVEHELRNPLKGFQREEYRAVKAAWMHRCGIVFMDFEKDFGPWGELIFGEESMTNYMWDQGYHPHHILSGWLYREKRIQVDLAREMYGADWLEPDRIQMSKMGRADRPLLRGTRFSPGSYDDDSVTIGQCWYKNDRSRKYRDKKGGKESLLPEDQRYMSCAGDNEQGCGWRSPRQGDMMDPLPEAADQGCPVCGGNIERIDSLAPQESIYVYSRGKRLIIMAPHNEGPNDEPLYNGGWPVSRARSYPALFVFAEERPGRPMGGSAVSQAWDNQIALDQLKTMLVQGAFESKPIYIFPRAGLLDRDGRRFELRDDQERAAFRDDTMTQYGPINIDRIEGGGIDQSIPLAIQVMQSTATQYRGVADFGLTEDSSKNIPVGTVQAISKQEDLPMIDFVKRHRYEKGVFCGVLSDYITATYPPNRLARLNLEGSDQVLEVWGQDLPGFDFEIEDTPDFTGIEKERVESLRMLDQMASEALANGLPIEIVAEKVGIFAEEMHFPPSTVNKFQKLLMKMAESQQQAQQQQQMQQEDQAAQDMEAGVGVPNFHPSDAELEAQAMGAGAPQG